jgi:hypothetical protein
MSQPVEEGMDRGGLTGLGQEPHGYRCLVTAPWIGASHASREVGDGHLGRERISVTLWSADHPEVRRAGAP